MTHRDFNIYVYEGSLEKSAQLWWGGGGGIEIEIPDNMAIFWSTSSLKSGSAVLIPEFSVG